MNEIDVILENEVLNKSTISLREYPGGWRAYEQSAFHFARIFKTGKIEMRDNHLFIDLDKKLEFLHSGAMSLVRIESVAEGEIKIMCNREFPDFADWRSKIIDVLNE